MNSGEIMYGWAKELYPIHRSLTGKGVRETLGYVQKILPNLEIHSGKSNTAAFDWNVPRNIVKSRFSEVMFMNLIT